MKRLSEATAKELASKYRSLGWRVTAGHSPLGWELRLVTHKRGTCFALTERDALALIRSGTVVRRGDSGPE